MLLGKHQSRTTNLPRLVVGSAQKRSSGRMPTSLNVVMGPRRPARSSTTEKPPHVDLRREQILLTEQEAAVLDFGPIPGFSMPLRPDPCDRIKW
jgi:hypothetical protein